MKYRVIEYNNHYFSVEHKGWFFWKSVTYTRSLDEAKKWIHEVERLLNSKHNPVYEYEINPYKEEPNWTGL